MPDSLESKEGVDLRLRRGLCLRKSDSLEEGDISELSDLLLLLEHRELDVVVCLELRLRRCIL